MSFLQFNLIESGIKHFLWFLAPDRMSKIYLKKAKKKEKKKKLRVRVFESVSTRELDSRATCHLTNFNETLPI